MGRFDVQGVGCSVSKAARTSIVANESAKNMDNNMETLNPKPKTLNRSELKIESNNGELAGQGKKVLISWFV